MQFLKIFIPKGSVATFFGSVGNINDFIAIFLPSLSVKCLRKLVNIWQRYEQGFTFVLWTSSVQLHYAYRHCVPKKHPDIFD